jgi:8-oxo-dGTP pyrophosphatase MutT (NUDIX family)
MERPLEVRSTARALLVTPAREILLLRYEAAAIGRHYWIAPGGGIEAGESERDAVAREIAEETGRRGVAIGPPVWTRRVPIRWADPPFEQREVYYWAPTLRFEPSMAGIPSEAERREIVDARWWRLDEIDASRERFAPRRLGLLLRSLFERGLPPAPSTPKGECKPAKRARSEAKSSEPSGVGKVASVLRRERTAALSAYGRVRA